MTYKIHKGCGGMIFQLSDGTLWCMGCGVASKTLPVEEETTGVCKSCGSCLSSGTTSKDGNQRCPTCSVQIDKDENISISKARML